MKLHQSFVAAGVALFLSGCAVIPDKAPMQAQNAMAAHEVRQAQQQIAQPFPAPGLLRVQRPLISSSTVALRPHELPAEFAREVNFVSSGTQSLMEITQTVGRMTGFVFDVREIATAQGAAPAAAPAPAGVDGLGRQTMSFQFRGSLSAMLDDLARRAGASWRFDHASREVVFFRYESRIFGLMLPPGSRDVSASISIGGGGGGGGGGGSGGGGGGSVSIESSMTVDPWTSVLDGVRVLLGQESGAAGVSGSGSAAPASGGEGGVSVVSGRDGRAIANRDLAQLIVVARPGAMQRVAHFIEQTNRRFARNLLIDVRVVELQSNDVARAGVNATALITNALRNAGIRGLEIQATGAPLLGGEQGSRITIAGGVGREGRSQLDLDAVLEAINSVARTTVRNQGQIVAINGQPAPFQQTNQISYIASTQTTQVPDVGTQTQVTPGTLTVGFTANFLPIVLADNRIMLQYQIQSSTLLGLRTVASGEQTIQLPEVFMQNLHQQAYLRDGDIIVLFGFEQERSQVGDQSGLLSLSRAVQANRIKTAIIIQVRTARS